MLLFDRFNLGHGFRRYFRIHPAIDDLRRDEVYRIRHEVFCEDFAFEPACSHLRATDAHDTHSLHCLMRTSSTPGTFVGYARLVLTNPKDPDYQLPFEHTCATTLDRSIIDPATLPRDRIAEISHLAIRAAFRRRRADSESSPQAHDEAFGTIAQPRFPYIPIGLYLGALALAARSGIDTIFILSEPRLDAHCAKLGINLQQIGQPVTQHGTRIPTMMDVQSVIKNMRFLVKPMWRVIQEEIERDFERAAGGARLTD